jgi:hypothetical protein
VSLHLRFRFHSIRSAGRTSERRERESDAGKDGDMEAVNLSFSFRTPSISWLKRILYVKVKSQRNRQWAGCSREASSVPCRYLLASSHLLLITSSGHEGPRVRNEGRGPDETRGGDKEKGRKWWRDEYRPLRRLPLTSSTLPLLSPRRAHEWSEWGNETNEERRETEWAKRERNVSEPFRRLSPLSARFLSSRSFHSLPEDVRAEERGEGQTTVGNEWEELAKDFKDS